MVGRRHHGKAASPRLLGIAVGDVGVDPGTSASRMAASGAAHGVCPIHQHSHGPSYDARECDESAADRRGCHGCGGGFVRHRVLLLVWSESHRWGGGAHDSQVVRACNAPDSGGPTDSICASVWVNPLPVHVNIDGCTVLVFYDHGYWSCVCSVRRGEQHDSLGVHLARARDPRSLALAVGDHGGGVPQESPTQKGNYAK